MDAAGPTARRFPLVARPRPACGPLPDRVAGLAERARMAEPNSDLAEASAVCNQAALIASDCGLPDLARTWCRQHAETYLRAGALNGPAARYALEPVVNLARLLIRAGDGGAAFTLLESLYEAVSSRTDAVIDTISVPASLFAAAGYRELREWLWSVHLADGTRALTAQGRWQDALTHLRRRKGIGQRMLDGRQVAVIAHATSGDQVRAQALIRGTTPGEPWENAVTACLAVLCHLGTNPVPAGEMATMLERYRQLTVPAYLAVFRARLGLSVIDAVGTTAHPAIPEIASALISHATAIGDGYVARDLLAHPACIAVLTASQAGNLAAVVDACALGNRGIPAELKDELSAAIATSLEVISRVLAAPPQGTGARAVPEGAAPQAAAFDQRHLDLAGWGRAHSAPLAAVSPPVTWSCS